MLNLCQFIGRCGGDPAFSYTPNGVAVCKVSIACSEKYKTKSDEKAEKTEWVNLVFWNKLAEIVGEYVKKGSLIYVSGKFTTRSWEKDGVKRYSTEIVCNDMKMLDGKKDNQQTTGTGTYLDNMQGGINEEDVPF